MIPEDGVNHEELEAEFLALVGGQPQTLEKLRGKGETHSSSLEHFLSSPVGQAQSWVLGRWRKGHREGPCPPETHRSGLKVQLPTLYPE